MLFVFVFTKMLNWTRITNTSYNCCWPFRSANYNTQHIPQTTNMAVRDPYLKTIIRDRSLNRQTSGYTYAQIPYIEKLAFPHFLRSIRFFCFAMLQTPNFFVCGCAIFVTDAKPGSFLWIDSFPQFGSMNRYVSIHLFSKNSGLFYQWNI